MCSMSVPVQDEGSGVPTGGLAICLSGGGYRAMMFHVGALWRLHELGFLEEAQLVKPP
jgi:NTE family protein